LKASDRRMVNQHLMGAINIHRLKRLLQRRSEHAWVCPIAVMLTLDTSNKELSTQGCAKCAVDPGSSNWLWTQMGSSKKVVDFA
jgi:hypothetical protein